jgi:16S rRNA C967 or C1407 C5-methylase (RsmB/RsmF family)
VVEDSLREGKALLQPGDNVAPQLQNGKRIGPPKPIEWLGSHNFNGERWPIGWQLGLDRRSLKQGSYTDTYLRQLNDWIVRQSAAGALTRQEIVSMIPATLLQIQSHHKVLDLCAAPGSKTTQLLEALHSNNPSSTHAPKKKKSKEVTGFIVANDVDAHRAYMLSKQCCRGRMMCCASRLIVTCHPAQRFPRSGVRIDSIGDTRYNTARSTIHSSTGSKSGGKGSNAGGRGSIPRGIEQHGYDRIVCDVPCSGDGTLRKCPEMWKDWSPREGMMLHSIQLQIAMRGASLLRVGGLMVYSTCTFNPIENEAVVAEILRRCRGSLYLLDAHSSSSAARANGVGGDSVWGEGDEWTKGVNVGMDMLPGIQVSGLLIDSVDSLDQSR